MKITVENTSSLSDLDALGTVWLILNEAEVSNRRVPTRTNLEKCTVFHNRSRSAYSFTVTKTPKEKSEQQLPLGAAGGER